MFPNFLDGEIKAFANKGAHQGLPAILQDPRKEAQAATCIKKKIGSELSSLGHHAVAKLETMMTQGSAMSSVSQII